MRSLDKPTSSSVSDALLGGAEPTVDADFNGAWLGNSHRATARKSIIISGLPRGGTSFAASIFAQLGVPYSRPGDRQIGRRYEHRDLRAAFQARDGDGLRRIARQFSVEFKVWAWKLPGIDTDIGFVVDRIPNPHFVFVFKEPLSIAARNTSLRGKPTLQALDDIFRAYRQLIDAVQALEHPTFLISYDRAVTRMRPFLQEAAKFAGIRHYDDEAVAAGIRQDGVRYFNKQAEAKDSPGLRAVTAATRRADPSPL